MQWSHLSPTKRLPTWRRISCATCCALAKRSFPKKDLPLLPACGRFLVTSMQRGELPLDLELPQVP